MQHRSKTVEENRVVSGFTGVALECIGDVYIQQGEEEALRIEASEDLMPLVTSEVEDGTLVLSMSDDTGVWNRLRGRKILKFYVTVKELDSIALSGAGDISCEKLVSRSLDLTIRGAGDVEIKSLTADELSVGISGAGDCTLAGDVGSQSLKISGAGDYDGGELESRDATVSVSGAGDALVSASGALAVSITGAGSVRYKGDPAVTSSVRGVGSLRPQT